jgi:type I restriction-modification system DNA methylase subunit
MNVVDAIIGLPANIFYGTLFRPVFWCWRKTVSKRQYSVYWCQQWVWKAEEPKQVIAWAFG